jgi:hypothetical protein
MFRHKKLKIKETAMSISSPAALRGSRNDTISSAPWWVDLCILAREDVVQQKCDQELQFLV